MSERTTTTTPAVDLAELAFALARTAIEQGKDPAEVAASMTAAAAAVVVVYGPAKGDAARSEELFHQIARSVWTGVRSGRMHDALRRVLRPKEY